MTIIFEKREKVMDNKKGKSAILGYIIVFLVPVMCITIYMYMHKCIPFGKYTILVGDGKSQYYPFLESLLEKIKNGESILWDWHSGMGYDYYSTFFYYMASPFNIIALLIGLFNLQLGVEITVIIQWALCGVTMLYYLSNTKHIGDDDIPYGNAVRMIFALSYSMCNFVLTYQHNFIWLISLIMAPIVMIGVEKLVNENKKKLYYISMVIVFITNFYFAWYICILALVWFIVQNKNNIKDCLRKGSRFILTSLLAAFSCGAVLVPCYYMVLFGNRRDRFIATDVELFDNVSNFMQGFFWAHNIDISPRVDASYADIGYCGIYILILCSMSLFNKNINIKTRLKNITIILISVFSLLFYYTNFVFQGFTRTMGNPSRFAFIFTLILIVMAYECLANMSKIQIRWLCVIAVFWSCVLGIVFLFNTEIQGLLCYLGTILLIVYSLICAFLYSKNEIKKKSFVISIAVVAFIEIISNFFIGIGETYYSAPREVMLEKDQWSQIYDNLQVADGERKTAYLTDQFYFAYSDTDMFSSTINGDMVDTFYSFGMEYMATGRLYAYKYTTPVTAALFNVRYVLTDSEAYYGGYNKVKSKRIHNDYKQREYDIGVYENNYMTGIGFVVDEDVLNWNIENKNPIDYQNEFATDVLKTDSIFKNVDLNNINVSFDGTEIYDISGLDCIHKSTNTDDIKLQYTFTVPSDMDMYIWSADNVSMQVEVFVDGESLMEEPTASQIQHILHVGQVYKNQLVSVNLRISGSKDIVHKTCFGVYSYDERVMQACVSIMRQQLYEVEEITNRGVVGWVDAKNDGILMTTIPYYKGMNVYVDDKKTEIKQIANGFSGVSISKGKHNVRFEYCPYGLKIGGIISLMGIVISLLYWVNSRRKLADCGKKNK